MEKVKLNKKRKLQLHFNSLFNKKSNYLKNLENIKTERIKEIENEKVELLIDKCLGINRFNRDYSFFNPSNFSSREHAKEKKLRLFPELKVLITSPSEKEYPNRYKQKDFFEDNFSYKNNYNFEKGNYNNKMYSDYKPINKNILEIYNGKHSSVNGKNQSLSFLKGVGKQIMTLSIEKDNLNNPKRKRKIINNISLK